MDTVTVKGTVLEIQVVKKTSFEVWIQLHNQRHNLCEKNSNVYPLFKCVNRLAKNIALSAWFLPGHCISCIFCLLLFCEPAVVMYAGYKRLGSEVSLPTISTLQSHTTTRLKVSINEYQKYRVLSDCLHIRPTRPVA